MFYIPGFIIKEFTMTEVNNEQLLQFVERIERIENDIASLKDDEKQIYSEAKSSGYDVKALKQIIKIRKADPDKLEQEEAIVENYKTALGM
jgi:uncharacterized protein (UPF0335 family)